VTAGDPAAPLVTQPAAPAVVQAAAPAAARSVAEPAADRSATRAAAVVVVGDVVTDVLAVLSGPIEPASDTPARITLGGGGAGANTAAWLAAAGGTVTFCGVVGVDAAGEARLSELASAGVRLAVRRTAAAPTGSIVVLTGPDERTMLADRGANLLLTPADVDAALAGPADATHLHLSGYVLLDPASAPAGRHALATARAHGLTTSVDAASAGPLRRAPAFLEWVRGADVLLANLDEALVLVPAGAPGEVAARLADAVGGLAVVKLGGAGAMAAGRDGRPVSVPAVPAEARDATGAGDAFAAGFLVGGIELALQAAARCVAQVGAQPSWSG
jgi:sugar/nucleoside kinase (ribokinase family)